MSLSHKLGSGLVAFSLLLSSSVWAELPLLSTLRKADDDNKSIAYLGRTVSKLEDMKVVNQTGKKIAEIEKVLINDKNEVVAFVIELKQKPHRGRDVVVEAGVLSLDGTKAKNMVSSLTAEQLALLPVWDD